MPTSGYSPFSLCFSVSLVSSLLNIDTEVSAGVESPVSVFLYVSQSVTHFLGRRITDVKIKLFFNAH